MKTRKHFVKRGGLLLGNFGYKFFDSKKSINYFQSNLLFFAKFNESSYKSPSVAPHPEKKKHHKNYLYSKATLLIVYNFLETVHYNARHAHKDLSLTFSAYIILNI